MDPQKKYLVVIAGPTAGGKTDLAVTLAIHYHTAVVSADSRQFYREMEAGTAKPDDSLLRKVPHYFINSRSIHDTYGAGHFAKEAQNLLRELFFTHNLVIMTGGSGLYIDAVLNGLDEFVDVPVNLRNELNQQYGTKGLSWLQSEVQDCDPVFFRQVDKMNPQRLIRALEITRHTGIPYSEFLNRKKPPAGFTPIGIFLNRNREELYKRINDRVDEMLAKGLEDEAQRLYPFRDLYALRTVGYSEMFAFIDGKYDLAVAIDKIKQHSRNYAKRQITWFRNRSGFREFTPGEVAEIITYIDKISGNGKGL